MREVGVDAVNKLTGVDHDRLPRPCPLPFDASVPLRLTISEARTAYSVRVFLDRTRIGGFSGYVHLY